MAGPGPEANDNEAAVKILLGVSLLVFFGDHGGGLIGFLRLLEPPLLLVGKDFDENEEDKDSRECHIGEVEFWGLRERGYEDEDVGWRGYHEQQERLAQSDEEYVE